MLTYTESPNHTDVEIKIFFKNFKKRHIPHEVSDFGLLTISAGVTLINSTESRVEAAFEEADSALYVAKNNGRNRVEFDLESIPS